MAAVPTLQIMDIPPAEFGGGTAKALLTYITDRADENGVAFPSRDDIGRRSGKSLSTVTRETRRLRSLGWLQIRQRHNGSNIYKVNVAKIAQMSYEISMERAALKQADDEFEPFEGEETDLQPVENKGVGHSDTGYGHGDSGSGHGDSGSGHPRHTNLSLNLSLNKRAALAFYEYPEKVQSAVREYFKPTTRQRDREEIEAFLESVGCSCVLSLDGLKRELGIFD
jgi:DNA-binding transcriptional MocR family regulator